MLGDVILMVVSCLHKKAVPGGVYWGHQREGRTMITWSGLRNENERGRLGGHRAAVETV